MKVFVNGQERELAAGATVLDLLALLRMEVDRVAVELNRAIISKKQFGETTLTDCDTVEIVWFVGGG